MAIPKLVYLFTVLPHPCKDFIATLKRMFNQFLWENKERIASEQLELYIHEGGLKLTDIDLFIKCLKLSWIKRLQNNINDWHFVFEETFDFRLNIKVLL